MSPTAPRLPSSSGREDRRISTQDPLLRRFGVTLAPVPAPGAGVDRTAIREMLAMTPAERLHSLVAEARVMERLANAQLRS